MKKTDEPPLLVVGLIIISLLIWAFCLILAWQGIGHLLKPENATKGIWERNNSGIILIEGNSLKASVPLMNIKPRVLGMMTSNELEYEVALLLNKIAECESGWKESVCNAKYGCRSGQGVFQIIPSTAKTCEKNLGRPINPFNEQDSLDCAIWLLTETSQGYHHWGTPTSWWGSYWCWYTAIPI